MHGQYLKMKFLRVHKKVWLVYNSWFAMQYQGGKYFSLGLHSNRAISLIGWKVFYDDGTKEVHHNKDFYVLDDGKAFATNDIHPYLAKIGTAKFGRWSKNSLFNKILAKGDTNFHDNWNKRENLKYDYYNHIFPVS